MRDFTVCSSLELCINPNAGFLLESDYYVIDKNNGRRHVKCKQCQIDKTRKRQIASGVTGKGATKKLEEAAHSAWNIKIASRYITSGFL